jgi:HD superfamily phosphohydrolase YqeK
MAMNEKPGTSFDDLRDWFSRYADSFSSTDPDLQFNLTMKKKHTLRVVDEIIAIGSGLGMPEQEIEIARIAALLHDVGRFEQYTRYKTFVDRDSADHALLGINALHDHRVLDRLDPADRELVVCAIEHHNRPSIPENLSPRERLFCALLRDADKIDIMHILTRRYRSGQSEVKSAVEILMPERNEVSPDALADLMAGGIVRFAHVHHANDFKLLQMAWVFDMNFAPSLELFHERGYLEILRDALPDTEEVRRAYRKVKQEMERRVEEG